MLQALIDRSQAFVNGEVTVRLYKGSASVISRSSPCSLYSADLVTFEESSIAYDHHDAEGFIKLNGLRLRNWAARHTR
ncbi:argininosuccinate synthase domain-containing protein [Rhizobium sp. NXC14]|nr:argininosuccinate synthase domain-containing protein [Rhizobium sp. NXC14]